MFYMDVPFKFLVPTATSLELFDNVLERKIVLCGDTYLKILAGYLVLFHRAITSSPSLNSLNGGGGGWTAASTPPP